MLLSQDHKLIILWSPENKTCSTGWFLEITPQDVELKLTILLDGYVPGVQNKDDFKIRKHQRGVDSCTERERGWGSRGPLFTSVA